MEAGRLARRHGARKRPGQAGMCIWPVRPPTPSLALSHVPYPPNNPHTFSFFAAAPGDLVQGGLFKELAIALDAGHAS